MRPFPPPEKVWPDDPATGEPSTMWHVYLCPDARQNTQLAELVAAAQAVAEQAAPGCVVPVEPQWLHATVHPIDWPGWKVGRQEVDEIASSLARELAAIPPFTVSARTVSATNGGVVLDLDGDRPGEPWHLMSEVVGEVIAARFGRHAVRRAGAAHMSAGYGAMEVDSGIVQSALRRARLLPVPVTVDVLHVLEVRQHAAEHRYTWNTATALPIRLGG